MSRKAHMQPETPIIFVQDPRLWQAWHCFYAIEALEKCKKLCKTPREDQWRCTKLHHTTTVQLQRPNYVCENTLHKYLNCVTKNTAPCDGFSKAVQECIDVNTPFNPGLNL